MAHDDNPRISASDGVATLWLDWPGRIVNGWNRARLEAFDRALSRVIARTDFDLLVIRSAKPDGFCGGFDPNAFADLRSDSDAAAFALAGQCVLRKLSNAPLVTLAFVEGPCLGPGLELALACDYRLVVEGPNSRVGFGEIPTCWGGRTRWRQLTGRGAPEMANPRSLNIFDGVCCERRAKIDLRTWLDHLLANPVIPRKPWRSWLVDAASGFAEERRQFVRNRPKTPANAWSNPESVNPIPGFPPTVGLVGNGPRAAALAWEIATRGKRVIRLTDDLSLSRPARLTPLELSQAEGRISRAASESALADCGLVIVDDSELSPAFLEHALPARTVLAVAPADAARFAELARRPGRVVGLEFAGDSLAVVYPQPATTPDVLASLGAWLQFLGYRPIVTHECSASSLVLSRQSMCDSAVMLDPHRQF